MKLSKLHVFVTPERLTHSLFVSPLPILKPSVAGSAETPDVFGSPVNMMSGGSWFKASVTEACHSEKFDAVGNGTRKRLFTGHHGTGHDL
jgi:hypothetical protein